MALGAGLRLTTTCGGTRPVSEPGTRDRELLADAAQAR